MTKENVCLILLAGLIIGAGCAPRGDAVRIPRPEKYFSDSRVLELCHAIEAGDCEAIDALLDAGVDIESKGGDNLTPLMWAFAVHNLSAFEYLLDRGADPNVLVGKYLETSVMHMGAVDESDEYLKLAVEHGGSHQRRGLQGSAFFRSFTFDHGL